MGRTTRSSATAKMVCDALEAGDSLRTLCGDPDFPSKTFILDWAEDDADFAGQYARAKERGWHSRAEAAVDGAKTAEDSVKGRLAFDADRWYLGKMLPKVYGERQVLAGDPDAPLMQMSDEQVEARLAALLAKGQG